MAPHGWGRQPPMRNVKKSEVEVRLRGEATEQPLLYPEYWNVIQLDFS